MFVKERFPPVALLTLDAAIARLKDGHPRLPVIQQKAAQLQKGYNGERKLDYHLQSLDHNFSILSDVTLSVLGRQFQIDSLIISSYAIYIVEVKNLSGELTFNTRLNQLTQQNGEVLFGRKYPITQVKNIAYLLQRWLEQMKINLLNIYYFVGLADQNAIIHVNGDEEVISKYVSYVEELPMKIVKTDLDLRKIKRENNRVKNQTIKYVLENLEELQIDILRKTGVELNDILPGVKCPTCEKLGMIRKRYNWFCPDCHSISKDAHKKAFLDFALIYGREISNRQCSRFLNVSSGTAYTILRNTKGVSLHKNKRKWIIDVDYFRMKELVWKRS